MEKKMNSKAGRALMSYFKNKQGLKIRTYGCEVENEKAKVVLVHGIRSHFRADYCGYNVDWYFHNLGEYTTKLSEELANKEYNYLVNSKSHPPNSNHNDKDNEFNLESKVASNSSNKDGEEDKLKGLNAFEVSKRFKYEGTLVEYLNNLGFSVYGLDHQSHGWSESFSGRRCDFRKFDDVCLDLLQFLALVKANKFHEVVTYNEEEVFPVSSEGRFTTSTLYGGQRRRLFLVGLSMGGNVVLRTQELFSQFSPVDAVVCCAGMLNIDFQFPPPLRSILPLLRMASKFVPYKKVGKLSNFNETLTMFMRYHDPLYYKDKLYLKMALMILDATKTLFNNLHYYPSSLPTLLLHASNDDTCDVKGPRQFMKYFNQKFNPTDQSKDDSYPNELQEANKYHFKLHELEGSAHVITSPLFTTQTGPQMKKFLQNLL